VIVVLGAKLLPPCEPLSPFLALFRLFVAAIGSSRFVLYIMEALA
jgi:hypothetical protein